MLKADHFGPSINIDVHFHVAPSPVARLAGGDTLMEYPRELGGLLLTNAGKGVLHWTAWSSEAWLTLEAGVSGSTAPRDSGAISFRIDRDAATTDTVADIIIESDDAGSPLVVSVHVRGIPSPSYTMLPGPVTAAEPYPAGMQALIGSSLTLVDIDAGTVRSVPLPKPGIELVVVADRTVVSHDSSCTVVNTSTLAVEQHVPLDFEVEAMAASWGWVHLVPRGAASARIIGIDRTDPGRRNEYVGNKPPLHDLAASGSIVYGAYVAHSSGQRQPQPLRFERSAASITVSRCSSCAIRSASSRLRLTYGSTIRITVPILRPSRCRSSNGPARWCRWNRMHISGDTRGHTS